MKEDKQVKVRGFSDPWANLAAAIIHTGVQCHDELFLKSKWCAMLADMISLASEIEDSRSSVGSGIHATAEQRNRQRPGGTE